MIIFVMKYTLFAALFMTSQAYADFFFIQNSKIYSVGSKYSPESTSFDKAHFLKIDVKENRKNGTVTYKAEGTAVPGPFSLQKTPSAPKIIAGEGCAENPMSWLKSSKVLGQLKKKDSAMYVQIAPEATSFGKTAMKCPTEDRFTENSPQFSIGDKDFAILVCSGDLNYNLLVMKTKAIEADLTITDNCP